MGHLKKDVSSSKKLDVGNKSELHIKICSINPVELTLQYLLLFLIVTQERSLTVASCAPSPRLMSVT